MRPGSVSFFNLFFGAQLTLVTNRVILFLAFHVSALLVLMEKD